MNPSQNAIEVVKILWRDARIEGTQDGWQKCAHQLGGIQVFLFEPDSLQSPDYYYIRDMTTEAEYMVKEAK